MLQWLNVFYIQCCLKARKYAILFVIHNRYFNYSLLFVCYVPPLMIKCFNTYNFRKRTKPVILYVWKVKRKCQNVLVRIFFSIQAENPSSIHKMLKKKISQHQFKAYLRNLCVVVFSSLFLSMYIIFTYIIQFKTSPSYSQMRRI